MVRDDLKESKTCDLRHALNRGKDLRNLEQRVVSAASRLTGKIRSANRVFTASGSPTRC